MIDAWRAELPRVREHPLIAGAARGALAVIAAGSLVDGVGNDKSDFDLYVIVDKRRSDEERYERMIRVGARAVEIVCLLREEVEHIVNTASSSIRSTDMTLSPYDLLLAHRLTTGVVLDGEDYMATTRRRLPKAQLAAYACESLLRKSADILEDLVATLGQGQLLEAAFHARWLVESSFDAALASLGNTLVHHKWRVRVAQVSGHRANPFYRDFIKLVTQRSWMTTEEMSAYIDDAKTYFQDVCSSILADRLSLSLTELLPFRQISAVPPGPYVRPCDVQIRLIEGRVYAFRTVTPVCELDVDTAKLWLCTYAASAAEMEQLCTKLSITDTGGRFRQLCKAGLLESRLN